jgi:hypothetical protein
MLGYDMFIFETLDEVRSGTSNKRPARGSNAARQQCFKTKKPSKIRQIFFTKEEKTINNQPFHHCLDLDSFLQITIFIKVQPTTYFFNAYAGRGLKNCLYAARGPV